MVQPAWKRHPDAFLFLRMISGFAALFLFLGVPCWAQITNVTEDQAPPTAGVGHDYIHLLSETVNPATGSVSLRISTPVPPGRGLTVPFSFTYDSNSSLHLIATFTSSQAGIALGWSDNADYLAAAGWGYGIPIVTTEQNQESYSTTGFPPITFTCDYYVDYMFSDLGGTAHALGISPIEPANTGQCEYENGNAPPNPHNFLTGGDDFVKATTQSMTNTFAVPVTVADADGTVYYFSNFSSCVGCTAYSSLPRWIEDRNGNKITFSTSGKGAFAVTDTESRTLLSSSGFGSTGNTVSVSGLSNPYTVTWGSTNRSFSVHSTVNDFEGGTTSCATVPTIGGTQPIITKISLPNGQDYQFQYDSSTGLVNKITYPSGGYVRYVWGTSPSAESMLYPAYPYSSSTTEYANDGCQVIYDTIAVAERFVSFDGSHEVQEQDFSYTTNWNTSTPKTWTSKTTTVTTKDLVRGTSFQTQYTYSPVLVPQQPNDLIVTGNSGTPVETQIVYFDSNGAKLQTVNKTWDDQYLLANQKTTLNNGMTSEVAYTYGAGAQVTEKDDYDFGPSLKRKMLTTYQSFGATPIYPGSSSPLLDKPCKVVVEDSSSNPVAETDYLYDGGSSVCGTSGGASTQSASMPSGTHDETNYGPGSSTPRGNATEEIRKCLSGCSQNAITTFSYDETGQVLSRTDPCGNTTCGDVTTGTSHTTTYSYTDSYSSCSGAAPPSGNTNAYLTRITNPFGFIRNFCYGYDDGQLRGSTDENSQMTIYKYVDSLGRLTETDYPDGGQTLSSYNDTPPTPSITTEELISSGHYLTKVNVMDGMGLVTESELTSDPAGTDFTVTSYDGLGRAYTVTNPYRSTSDPTYGVTTYTYDALGRTTKVTEADGSAVNTTYSGNCTTVTDEAAENRESCTDGLGRLTSVVENPGGLGYTTNYTYDALGNLLSVSEAGSRSRSFAYNSLSELTSATNPESGTIAYTYDNNGNLATKKDARSITTTYNYDALNRLTQKSYSDGTPTADYIYDACPSGGCPNGVAPGNAIGRQVEAFTPSTKSFYSYDPMGRALTQWECTPLNCAAGPYPNGYTYNLLGETTSTTYLNAFTIFQSYDAAGRVQAVSSSLSDATHPPTLETVNTYDPAGQALQITYGNNVTGARFFNNRLQPCRINVNSSSSALNSCAGSPPSGNLLDLSYNWNAGTSDNGNVMGWAAAGSQIFNRTYTYDALSRLGSMSDSDSVASCQGLTWGYDAWGNRTAQTPTKGTCGMWSSAYTTNNRIVGYSYDAAGNLLSDGLNNYTYDAENRISAVDGGPGNGGVSYVYDANGTRVEKIKPGGAQVHYFTDLSGNTLVERDQNFGWLADYVYVGGQLEVLYYADTTFFAHRDHLGSTRLMTALNGSVYDSMDYLPFGEQIAGDTGTTHKFTGKERDSESGLDNFGARYDSSAMGRFMSPDPLPWLQWQNGNRNEQERFAKFIANPQNLNMYSYVDNNPLSYTDPTGMSGCKAGDKTFTTCTITIVYNPQTSQGTLTVTGQNKGDKSPTVLLTTDVVVGGDGHVTPTGTFTAMSWQKDHVSTKFGTWANTPWSKSPLGLNVFGPFQLHIKELDSRGIYIHGTLGPSWNPFTFGNRVVGSTSHGCIRMCNSKDIELHNLMPEPAGNKIVIRTAPDDNQ